jgi:hypothetical protein
LNQLTFGFDEEANFRHSLNMERRLLFSLQRNDALFDGLHLDLQVLKVFFEPSYLFLGCPEARLNVSMSATRARTSVMATSVPTTAMTIMSATHVLTS